MVFMASLVIPNFTLIYIFTIYLVILKALRLIYCKVLCSLPRWQSQTAQFFVRNGLLWIFPPPQFPGSISDSSPFISTLFPFLFWKVNRIVLITETNCTFVNLFSKEPHIMPRSKSLAWLYLCLLLTTCLQFI